MLASACLLAVERSRFVDVLASRRLSQHKRCVLPARHGTHWCSGCGRLKGRCVVGAGVVGTIFDDERTDARETPAKRRPAGATHRHWAFTGLPAVTRSELIVTIRSRRSDFGRVCPNSGLLSPNSGTIRKIDLIVTISFSLLGSPSL